MLGPLFLAQVFSCLYMTGVIWFVQIVHYPMFLLLPEHACGFHREQQRRTSLVVAFPMAIELATAGWIIVLGGFSSFPWWVANGLLAVAWLSTVFVQVPCHRKLAGGHSSQLVIQLVSGNWIRTVSWTLRSTLLGSILWNGFLRNG